MKPVICSMQVHEVSHHTSFLAGVMPENNIYLFSFLPVLSWQTQNICITFIQCWANVDDDGPTLYICYTNVLCLLDICRQYGEAITSILN